MRSIYILAVIAAISGCTLSNPQKEQTYSEVIDNIATAEILIVNDEFEQSYSLLNDAMLSGFQGAYLFDVYAKYYEKLGEQYLTNLANKIKAKKQSKSDFYLEMSKKSIHLYREYLKGQSLASLSLKYDHRSKEALILLAAISYAVNDVEIVEKVVKQIDEQNYVDSQTLLIKYLLSSMKNEVDADKHLKQIVLEYPNSKEALHIKRGTIDKSAFVAMRIAYLEKRSRILERSNDNPTQSNLSVIVTPNSAK